jgi:uncharacterized protein (DUF1800 family)
MTGSPLLRAAIAAHRFGLSEPRLQPLADDPEGWLLAQIGPADPALGAGLLDTRQALELVGAEREKRRLAANPPPGTTAAEILAGHYRETTLADVRSHLLSAARSARPFMERLQRFWSNHFTVSLQKGSARGLVGAFERDAIRPHIAGSFEALLVASTTHPAMLRYLDNAQSAGPHAAVVAREARRAARTGEARRVTGLNENLAREVLELHTLGAPSGRVGPSEDGYGQADVSAFAAVLTGWRVGIDGATRAVPFDAAWHEPGPKTVLGRRYDEGPEALGAVLHELARHPATARFVSTKLARHFVADDPPRGLVERLVAAWQRSEGDLPSVYRALVRSPEAWQPTPQKLKTPAEWVLSSARLLGIEERLFARGDGGIGALGQRLHAAPSPAGWSDRAEDWLGPDALWKRVEWATRTGERSGRQLDARALAAASLGPLLGDATRTQIENAADGPQALALLLMAPEFQRR